MIEIRMVRPIVLAACGAALAAGLAAAAPPAMFGKSQPGLWELSGIQGSRVPARLCIADLTQLALVEHRGRGCKQKAIRDTASSVTFTYECAPNEFGRTKIDYVTSKNFRIVSQGISGGLPFAHNVQARRVGDCAPKSAPSGH
jgi:hypothetical protein